MDTSSHDVGIDDAVKLEGTTQWKRSNLIQTISCYGSYRVRLTCNSFNLLIKCYQKYIFLLFIDKQNRPSKIKLTHIFEILQEAVENDYRDFQEAAKQYSLFQVLGYVLDSFYVNIDETDVLSLITFAKAISNRQTISNLLIMTIDFFFSCVNFKGETDLFRDLWTYVLLNFSIWRKTRYEVQKKLLELLFPLLAEQRDRVSDSI